MKTIDPLVSEVAKAIARTESRMNAVRYKIPRGKRTQYFGDFKEAVEIAQAKAAIKVIQAYGEMLLEREILRHTPANGIPF